MLQSMAIQQMLLQAQETLSPVTDNPLLEAELLLAHVLDKPRSYLYAWPGQVVSDVLAQRFYHYLERRCQSEPIAYMTGTREFWSLELAVSTATLIPRPETEIVVEAVLKLLPHYAMTVADLGTGCGAIALALAHERPKWQIYATDISESALVIARKNAQKLALKNISFHYGNWCTALPRAGFDVIVSNPPYIREAEWDAYADGLAFEPRTALVSGWDGLDAIRAISQSAKCYVKPLGYVLIEHGFLQGAEVRAIFAAAGYGEIHSLSDLSGNERVTMGRVFP